MLKKFSSFRNGNNTLLVPIGQAPSRCAGIALAAIEKYLLDGEFFLQQETFNDCVTQIKERGEVFYRLGVCNENEELGSHIELQNIYHQRTISNKNLVNLRDNSTIEFETGFSLYDQNGDLVPQLENYKEGYNNFTNDMKEFFNAGRQCIILHSSHASHFVTIFRVGNNSVVVDGLRSFRAILYEDFEMLVEDCKLFANASPRGEYPYGMYAFSHQQSIENPTSQSIANQTDNKNEKEKDKLKKKRTSRQKKKQEIESTIKLAPNAIDFDETIIIPEADAAEMRKSLERYHSERFRFFEKEMPPLFTNKKCRVIKCQCEATLYQCGGYCSYHYAIAISIQSITNGRLCSNDQCRNKAEEYANECAFHLRLRNHSDESVPPDYSIEQLHEIGHYWAQQYYDEVIKNPRLQIYFGVSEDPDHRWYEHSISNSKTSGFSNAKVLAWTLNNATASELEFETVRQFAQLAGHQHVRNFIAGGSYKTRNNRKSALYVLTFEEGRELDEKDQFPWRNFEKRTPFLTHQINNPYPQLSLQLFTRSLRYSQGLRLLGYELELTQHEVVSTRNEEYKCKQCTHSFSEKRNLDKHFRRCHSQEFQCLIDECPYATSDTSSMKRHKSDIHDTKWTSKSSKFDEYKCGVGECTKIFSDKVKASYHRRITHFNPREKCKFCMKEMKKLSLPKHYEVVHPEHKTKTIKEVTKYYCKLCEKRFASTENLRLHSKSKSHLIKGKYKQYE